MTVTDVTPRAVGLDPDETMVGTSNGVGLWIAPEGTMAPADLAAFTTPWQPLGYASDDGVTLGGDSSSESFIPWQGTSPIRTIITEVTRTVGFTLWQLNERTLGLYFDADVPSATDGVYGFDILSGGGALVHAIGVDALDGGNQFRIVFPRAQLDAAGDMVIQKGAMIPLEVTLSALDAGGILAHVDIRTGGGGTTRITVPTPSSSAA